MNNNNENEVLNLPAFDLMVGFSDVFADEVNDLIGDIRCKAIEIIEPSFYAYGRNQLQITYTYALDVILDILSSAQSVTLGKLVNVVLHPHINPGQNAR